MRAPAARFRNVGIIDNSAMRRPGSAFLGDAASINKAHPDKDPASRLQNSEMFARKWHNCSSNSFLATGLSFLCRGSGARNKRLKRAIVTNS